MLKGFNLDDLKKIDPETQDIVFGYIRKAEKLLIKSNNGVAHPIPYLIGFICLAYYYLGEYFDKYHIHKGLSMSEDTAFKYVTRTSDMSVLWPSVFGKTLIKSSSNCHCKWYISFDLTKQYFNYIVGITSNPNKKKPFHRNGKDINYGYYPQIKTKMCKYQSETYGKRAYNYLRGIVTVTVDLNLKTKTLSYYVNDDYEGIAYQNIETSEKIKYCLAISLSTSGVDGNAMIKDFICVH